MPNFCKACDSPLKENAKFCNGCGAKADHLPPTVEAEAPAVVPQGPPTSAACLDCRGDNSLDAKFCRHCGALKDGSVLDLTANAPQSESIFDRAEGEDNWDDKPSLLWKRNWFIPAMLGLVAVVGVGGWYATQRNAVALCTGSDATNRPDCAQAVDSPVTGKAQDIYIIADANIRDSATAEGSNVVTKLLRGKKVNGLMQLGVDGESHWFKLTDGRGFVGATNLGSAAPPELSRVFDNMPWNVEGSTELLANPEVGSLIVASLANGEGATLAGVTKNGYAEVKLKQGGVGYFIITSQNDATGVLSGVPKELTFSFNHDTCEFGPDFKSYFDMALRNAQKLGKSGDGASSYVKLNGAMFGLHPTAVGAHSESSGIYFQEEAGQVVKAFLDHGFRFEKNDAFVGYNLIDGSTSGIGASISDTTGEEAQYGKSSFSCGL